MDPQRRTIIVNMNAADLSTLFIESKHIVRIVCSAVSRSVGWKYIEYRDYSYEYRCKLKLDIGLF